MDPLLIRPPAKRILHVLGTACRWLAVLGMLGVPCAKLSAQTPQQTPGPVVQTQEGPVQGFTSSSVVKFLGIPYAEPPVGDLRWRPPVARTPWTQVLPATDFGPICAVTTTLGVFSGPRNTNEDCLYLNVFTPDPHPSSPLPVIVFIHGGGDFAGSTPGYDASKLASQGKTVVVTMAYRLNLMGFLAHPALDSEGHLFANYGLLDQQAALHWVQRNIAAFGGDKDNVTFGGQSAGAVDMMAHLVSPLTEGLFHKAICESYCSAIFPFPAKDVAEANGVAFAQAAGCGAGSGPDVARCLRNLPASKILELSGTESARSRFTYNTPIMDGQIIPDQPITLFSNGRYHRVPLLNGAVKDEGNFPLAIIAYFSNPRSAVTLEQYLKYTEATYVPPAYPEGTAAKVLAAYPLDTFKSPMAAWDRSTSDWALCNMRHLDLLLARSIPVYTYEFADQTAPSYFPDMPGVETLAFHTVDIQYIFPLWHGGPLGRTTPLDPAQTKLSDQIVSAWTNFARSGNPNGSGDMPWPRFKPDVQEATWLIQDLPAFSAITDQKFSLDHRCDLWDAATR